MHLHKIDDVMKKLQEAKDDGRNYCLFSTGEDKDVILTFALQESDFPLDMDDFEALAKIFHKRERRRDTGNEVLPD